MSTFNAGAIEANLALGRSDWNKDLKKLKREIQDLENTTITIGIDADADNAKIAMDNIEMMLENLDEKTYTPAIDADQDAFRTAMEQIDERLDALDSRIVTVQVFADTDNAQVSLNNLENDLDVLDRDPVTVAIDVVTKEANAILSALEARLDALETRNIVVGVDADVDNALVQLNNIESYMDLLENDPVNIHVDAEISEAAAELAEIAAIVKVIDTDDIDIDVDADGVFATSAELAALHKQVQGLDGSDIDIDVNTDRGMLEALTGPPGGGGGGHLGLLRILIYAIIALSPVLSAAIGASTAAVAAFAGALAGAAGAALVLGGGLVGLVARFKATDPSEYTESMQNFADSIDLVKDAWNSFLDDIDDTGYNLMADGLELVADIIPTLVPLFESVAEMFGGVTEGIRGFVDSPEYDEMIGFFSGFGVDMLESFLQIGGNLLRFFGRLFDALAPFARVMMDGLEEITAGWMEWADDLEDNDSFQTFLENAMEYGPKVLDMLGSLLGAFINIGRALEPFAGPMLDGLIWFFDIIAEADPEQLTLVIGALAGLWLGIHVLLPLITGLTTILPALGPALAVAFSPVGAIVLALGALAGLMVYMYETNENFRGSVNEVWAEIQETVEPIIEDITSFIRENWGSLTGWIQETWDEYGSIIEEAAEFWGRIIEGALNGISILWAAFGDDWLRIIKGAFQAIGGLLQGWVQIIHGIFMTLNGLATGDWSRMWDGIKKIGEGRTTVVSGIVRGFGGIIGGLFSAASSAVQGFWSGMWGGIAGTAERYVQNIRTIVSGLVTFVSTQMGNITSGISTVRGKVNDVIGGWNAKSFTIGGYDPPGPGPKFPGFTIHTPDVSYLARGGYITEPTLAVVGEGADPEVVAPEPVLRQIVRENSGADLDYGRLAAAIASALEPLISRFGLSKSDIERLIQNAGATIKVEDNSNKRELNDMASAVLFNLRLLGFGEGVN